MASTTSKFDQITAWNSPYKGDSAKYFIKLLQDTAVRDSADGLSNYFPVVQSSGTGKSRLADEVAKQIFTIPICLSNKADNYPPADTDARDFLVEIARTSDNIERECRFMSYFTALLMTVKADVEKHLKPYSDHFKSESKRRIRPDYQTLSKQWRDHLYMNGFTNRKAIFNECMQKMAVYPQYSYSDIERLREPMINAAKMLLSFIEGLTSNGVPFIILSIDEVDTLMLKSIVDKDITQYFTMILALSARNIPSIYVTVQSSAGFVFDIVPSESTLQKRFVEGSSFLQAPFIELDFDANVVPIKESQHNLQQVCTSEFISQFGRSLFKAAYDYGLKDEIIAFTERKLLGGAVNLKLDESGLQYAMMRAAIIACLDVRFLLSHDTNRLLPLPDEQLQISSNLRDVQVVPKHREYLFSGYALEPLVAEAAANLLRLETPGNARKIIKIADRLFRHYFKAKGERGEFISRFLLMVAHDKAVAQYTIPTDPQLKYSRPVRVLDFLKCLFGKKHHPGLLQAMPEVRTQDEKTLEVAFENAYVNFTQFCRAADKNVCHVSFAWQGLVRGVAIQCCGTQKGTDIVIPIVFSAKAGQPEHAMLGSSSVSAIMIQVKNRIDAKDASLNINDLGFFKERDDIGQDEDKDEDKDEDEDGDGDKDEDEDEDKDEDKDEDEDEDTDRDDDNKKSDKAKAKAKKEKAKQDRKKNEDRKELNELPYIFIVMRLGVKNVNKSKKFKVRTPIKRLQPEREGSLFKSPKKVSHPQYKIMVTGIRDVYDGIGDQENAILQNLLSTKTYEDEYPRLGENRKRGLKCIEKTGITVHGHSQLIPLEK